MIRNVFWKLLPAIFVVVTCGSVTAQGIPGGKNAALAPTKATSMERQNGANDSSNPPAQRNPRYKLCTSDSIALAFPLTPEFNQTIVIQPDGFASLAGAGDVYLAGLTTAESVTAIEKAYTKILHDPIVTIELKDFNKPYFIVSGQVNKPGKYDLRGYTSATQAVAIAGGFNDSAKHSQVLVFRRVNDDWYEVKLLDLKKILKGRDLQEDLEVRPGDMLFVPQNFISKIKKFIPSTGVGTYYQLYQ
ncbi:MAG TPA: polysaccharide biosynthesis/export family protein [Candidatus Acidoferrales bacterium]|nr:polysaccharide biosynthesis/export family protein [Candidatus Acidoferrales bacterium]